jgi:hypothetical protein
MSKNISVYGIYASRAAIESGVMALKDAGFRHVDISLLSPENKGNHDLVTEKSSKAPEGATVGIGALAIPGLGPFIAAGPIMAALAGMGAGAALGGVTGGLVGMGMPEFEATRYAGRVKEGGSLMSVHCDDSEWAKRAEEVLRRTGAEDITRAGQATADFDKTDKPHRVGTSVR